MYRVLVAVVLAGLLASPVSGQLGTGSVIVNSGSGLPDVVTMDVINPAYASVLIPVTTTWTSAAVTSGPLNAQVPVTLSLSTSPAGCVLFQGPTDSTFQGGTLSIALSASSRNGDPTRTDNTYEGRFSSWFRYIGGNVQPGVCTITTSVTAGGAATYTGPGVGSLNVNIQRRTTGAIPIVRTVNGAALNLHPNFPSPPIMVYLPFPPVTGGTSVRITWDNTATSTCAGPGGICVNTGESYYTFVELDRRTMQPRSATFSGSIDLAFAANQQYAYFSLMPTPSWNPSFPAAPTINYLDRVNAPAFPVPGLQLTVIGSAQQAYHGTNVNPPPFPIPGVVATITQLTFEWADLPAGALELLSSQTYNFMLRINRAPERQITYNIQAPNGITVTSGGANQITFTPTGPVVVPVQIVVGSFGTNNGARFVVDIRFVQSAGYAPAYRYTLPDFTFTVVPRSTLDGALKFDTPLPTDVLLGGNFKFSVRAFPPPPNGIVLTFSSSCFIFDSDSLPGTSGQVGGYTLNAANSGILVTGTSIYSYGQAYSGGDLILHPTYDGVGTISCNVYYTITGPDAAQYVTSGTSNIVATNQATPTANWVLGTITVRRRTWFANSVPAATYNLPYWGVPSRTFIYSLRPAPITGVNLVPRSNCAFMTFSAPQLNYTSTTLDQAFTVTAWPEDQVPRGRPTCAVSFSVSGVDAPFYTVPAGFTIQVPQAFPVQIGIFVNGPGGGTDLRPPYNGTIQVAIGQLPPSAGGFVLTPSWPHGTFTPASLSWTSSDTVLVKSLTYQYNAAQADTFTTSVSWALSGQDSNIYQWPAATALQTVTPRTVTVPIDQTIKAGQWNSLHVFVGQTPRPGYTLTVRPLIRPAVAALNITPAFYTFDNSGNSNTDAVFNIYSNSPTPSGTQPWIIDWQLEGSDAGYYSFGANRYLTQVTVSRRSPAAVTFTQSGTWTAGVWYGPFAVQLDDLPTVDNGVTVTPWSVDLVFDPPVLSFSSFSHVQPFRARYSPRNPLSLQTGAVNTFNTYTDFLLGGVEAPFYTAQTGSSVAITVTHRVITINGPNGQALTSTNVVSGVPTMIWVNLPDNLPSENGVTVNLYGDNLQFASAASATINTGSGSTNSPYAVTFPAASSSPIVSIPVLVIPTFRNGWAKGDQCVSISYTVTGADAGLYSVPARSANSICIVHRQFYWDNKQLQTANSIENPLSNTAQFVVGIPSQLLSVAVTSSITTAVTLTPQCGIMSVSNNSASCPWVTFSPPSLVFNAGDMVKSFYFTPIALPPQGAKVFISFVAQGANSWEFDLVGGTNKLPNKFGIQIIPRFVFSPIPPIWIDGHEDNLFVSVAAPSPVVNLEPFALVVKAASDVGVVITPSILPFSQQNLVQSFSISHARPSQVDAAANGAKPKHFYKLTWQLKYQGTDALIDLDSRIIPVDATEVRVVRYAIQPDFPAVISNDWDDASINISRPGFGDITLVPGLPNAGYSGSTPVHDPSQGYQGANQNGMKVPGGRILFDPPVIAFKTGENVARFRVRSDRLPDDEAIYVRVDYQFVAHQEDANCYLPFQYTWHMASSSSLTFAWAVLIAVLAVLVF